MTGVAADPFFVIQYVGLGVIFFIAFFYLLLSLWAGKCIKLNMYELSLYMSCAFFVAAFGEPLSDIFYRLFYGEYLWYYQILPIFGGASTMIGFLSWPFYGYYSYLLHQTFEQRDTRLPSWAKALIPAIDGIPFDMLGNGFSLLVFGFIFFYYPRPELWHLSAWWVIPIYFVYGLIYFSLLGYLLKKRKHYLIPLAFYLAGCAIMLAGETLFKHL